MVRPTHPPNLAESPLQDDRRSSSSNDVYLGYMYILLALFPFLWLANLHPAGVPFGVYAIVQNLNIPIQVQAQVFTSLSLVSWAQCLHYAHGWKPWSSTVVALSTGILYGGVEAALILTLRPLYEHGTEWPMILIGVIASILLAGGLLPPYFEIWKRKGRVVGIGCSLHLSPSVW